MCQSMLSEEEMHDADLVRAKVHDMAKLGEMKWRYRVVDEGQSPRDEAIRILTEAKELVDKHMALVLEGKSAEAAADARERQRKEWADELSDVLQGLALTRLIFNTDRSEDSLIEKNLNEALELRQLAELKPQVGRALAPRPSPPVTAVALAVALARPRRRSRPRPLRLVRMPNPNPRASPRPSPCRSL